MLPLSPKPHTATTAAVASIQRPTCDWNCPFTIFLGGNKKYNRQYINNFLPLLKSSANEWERAKTIKNKQYKCSTQNAIALNCYNQWIGKGEQYKFASSATSCQLTSADEVMPHLLKCIRQYTYRRSPIISIPTIKGISFPDFVEDKQNKKNRSPIPNLPLCLPDTWKGSDDGILIDHDFMMARMVGEDVHKFRKGANCYINGAVYSAIPKDVHILDPSRIGDFDLELDMLGAKEGCTLVRVRSADLTKPFFTNLRGIAKKFRSTTKNARCQHLSNSSKQYMTSFSEDDNGIPYVSNQNFNAMEPESLTINLVGKMIEDVLKDDYKELLGEIDKIENDGELSQIGMSARSLDVSINLVNAAHYDNGDAGEGVGLWFKDGCDHNAADNWYFLLPNCSIDGSKGVAIKLRHGLMISWNGREVKHCSVDPGHTSTSEDNLFGALVGPKQKFCLSDEMKMDLLTANSHGIAKYKHLITKVTL